MSTTGNVAIYRLFQLISPSLPIGGFTYSQGLELAVEAGWVTNRDSMEQWLNTIVSSSVATLELPILERLYHALERVNSMKLSIGVTTCTQAVKPVNCEQKKSSADMH